MIGSDYNNDRAIDVLLTGRESPLVFENPREGAFRERKFWLSPVPAKAMGLAVLDFNHDGWMDIAFSHFGVPGVSLWQNKQGKAFERVALPTVDWVWAHGVAAFDYDNDGWVDLVAVGETKDGKGEVRLFRNLGPDGWKDVSSDVGLDKIALKDPRSSSLAITITMAQSTYSSHRIMARLFFSGTKAAIKTTGCA